MASLHRFFVTRAPLACSKGQLSLRRPNRISSLKYSCRAICRGTGSFFGGITRSLLPLLERSNLLSLAALDAPLPTSSQSLRAAAVSSRLSFRYLQSSHAVRTTSKAQPCQAPVLRRRPPYEDAPYQIRRNTKFSFTNTVSTMHPRHRRQPCHDGGARAKRGPQ